MILDHISCKITSESCRISLFLVTRARFGAAAGEKSELSSDPDALSSRVRPTAFSLAECSEQHIEDVLTLRRHLDDYFDRI